MTTLRPTLRKRFLQVSAVAAWPLLLAAAAAPAQNDTGGPGGGCDHGLRGPPPRPPGSSDPGLGRVGFDGDEARPPPFLRDLNLNETQQDKVFAIVHAASPALRDQSKAVTKSREGLRDLVGSAQFSDASAQALADAQGKAESQLALTRARMEHDVYAVLSPEQQTLVAKRRLERPSWGAPGPGTRD